VGNTELIIQDKKQQRWYINKLRYNREYTKNHPEVRQKFLDTHPDYQKNANKKQIRFKGKSTYLGYNPRIGVCSKCGKSVKDSEINYTHLHHLKYDDNNPVKHTIELCIPCHRKEHIIEYSMTPAAVYRREYRARKRLEISDNV